MSILAWWKRLFSKKHLERQLDKELRFHFEQQVSDLIGKGINEAEARRRTRIEFGGLEQLKEDCREARGTLWLEASLADLRFAARMLWKSPAFTLAAVVTLALGIGANTAIFSVINAVFLRPLSYPHPERIVWTTEYYPNFNRTQMFGPEYVAWREQATAFEQLEAAGISGGVNLAADGNAAQRVQDRPVTPGFLHMLGFQPRLGRNFRPDDDQPSGSTAIILSDALWQGYFGSNRDIVGKPIHLDGAPATVVGVMPPGFIDPSGADISIWRPTAIRSIDGLPARSMNLLEGVIGRLKEGVTADQARANLEVVARRMDSHYPTPWSRYHAAAHVQVLPLQEQLTNKSKRAIYVLMGAVGFILLIGCANVGNMFLSRAFTRQREIAIRASLGASRLRVVRLLLTEGFLLSGLGGLSGLLVMKAAIAGLAFLLPAAIPPHIPFDERVFLFAVICSLLTSIVFGLVPALTISKLDLHPSLKSGDAGIGLRFRGISIRGAMAAAQLALSLILLVGAGLLLRSFLSLIHVDPGFNPHNVLLSEISLTPQKLYAPSRQVQFFRHLLETLRTMPGVEYAAVTDESPLATFQSLTSGLAAEGQPSNDATVVPSSISADYFKTLQIPLVAGRFFHDGDTDGSPRVAILNQRLAEILFGGNNPIGRRIRTGNDKDGWSTVVGVVGNIRHRGLDDKVWAELFQPLDQAPSPWMSVVIKTTVEPSNLTAAIRGAVARIDRNQALFGTQSLDQRLSMSVAQRRQQASLLSLLAFVALVIAVTGIYGMLVYSVACRNNEMGVRFALGAQAADVLAMILAEGMKIALAGIAVGIIGALALTRLIASFLYTVTPVDPVAFISAALLLGAAACVACYIPARRASKVDPMTVLRHE